MQIISWNVNSVRKRLPLLELLLAKYSPDVLCLQETKTEDISFPFAFFRRKGYFSYTIGQKKYNGVAIVVKEHINDLVRDVSDNCFINHDNYNFQKGENVFQARYLELKYKDLTIANIYVPNGNPIFTEKYDYKKLFLRSMIAYIPTLINSSEHLILCGDFNVIPEDESCFAPVYFAQDALGHKDIRELWVRLLSTGDLGDVLKNCSKNSKKPMPYTFWCYGYFFKKNKGMRIDHYLVKNRHMTYVDQCLVDSSLRNADSPSDHAPVILSYKLTL